MKKKLTNSRLLLVFSGVALGFLARFVLGIPEVNHEPTREIDRPLSAPPVEPIYFPIAPEPSDQPQNSGLIEPFPMAGQFMVNRDANFSHDASAIFEPHGESVCASGCAASRHPTGQLTRSRFFQLLNEVPLEPLDRTNTAMEELFYFGTQAYRFIQAEGFGPLDTVQSEFIWNQLQKTHALISIRVVDESGRIRTWLEPTRVPLDRRHVFEMETDGLQPLVTSGTVKRVGLDHLWVRL
ncbi:MAG: hypothetical protein AAF939_04725 [Planctomycetota bacterium]